MAFFHSGFVVSLKTVKQIGPNEILKYCSFSQVQCSRSVTGGTAALIPSAPAPVQLTFQRLTIRGVRSGRTSRRTCLWWGCRWGTRTTHTSQGRRRRGRPGRRVDPGRPAGRRRFGPASGTCPNARSWGGQTRDISFVMELEQRVKVF